MHTATAVESVLLQKVIVNGTKILIVDKDFEPWELSLWKEPSFYLKSTLALWFSNVKIDDYCMEIPKDGGWNYLKL